MSSNAISVILIGGIGEYGKLSKCAAHIPYVHVCPHTHKKVYFQKPLLKVTFKRNTCVNSTLLSQLLLKVIFAVLK